MWIKLYIMSDCHADPVTVIRQEAPVILGNLCIRALPGTPGYGFLQHTPTVNPWGFLIVALMDSVYYMYMVLVLPVYIYVFVLDNSVVLTASSRVLFSSWSIGRFISSVMNPLNYMSEISLVNIPTHILSVW